MTSIIIPEDLKEMIKEIIAYEDLEENEEEIERDLEWAREWAYINPPDLYRKKEKIEDTEETWKIEIKL